MAMIVFEIIGGIVLASVLAYGLYNVIRDFNIKKDK